MSDPRTLSVPHGVELAKKIRRTIADFSAEEAALNKRERDRRWALQRAESEGLGRNERQLAAETIAATEEFEARRAHAEEIHNERHSRIEKLAREALRTLPRRAQEVRERWVGELQMREFLMTRRLDTEREAAETKFKKASEALTTDQARLKKLEQRTRNAFTGYLAYLWKLRGGDTSSPPAGNDLDATLDRLDTHITEFRRLLLPKIFSFLPVPALLAIIGVTIFVISRRSETMGTTSAIAIGAVLAVILVVFHAIGKKNSSGLATEIADDIAEARRILVKRRADATEARKAVERSIEAEKKQMDDDIARKWERAEEVKAEFEAREQNRLGRIPPRAQARNNRLFDIRRQRIEADHQARMDHIQRAALDQRENVASHLTSEGAATDAEIKAAWQDLEQRWTNAIQPLAGEIDSANALAESAFPAWSRDFVESWTPHRAFTPATGFGSLALTLPPAGMHLPRPESRWSIPLALTYPTHGSILFESTEGLSPAIASSINQIILRLLATTPPGKLSFTILDPVGLGRNFAGLMHLADFEETLITRRIWTQTDQIEERLAELSQHIEKVIQMYLRDEYPTILEYNAQAGSTAEKFHFLVIADFPANFSEIAIKRLQSILASGPRCGVHTLIHWNHRLPLPSGIAESELRANSVCIREERGGLVLIDTADEDGVQLLLEDAPPPDLAQSFIDLVGQSSIDSNQVQVPFDQIAPAPGHLWQGDTTNELRIAVGRSGATKQQMLAIGKGTRQHALVAGKTGSGKSTLFHVIITNLALTCSPEQVEFYLIDFKKGVEFKCYGTKRLPHARVIAIESDREFGLSVLQRVDDELRRRGDLYRKLGVQDLAGYKRESGQPMPRTLLLIDEFQELFVEDDVIAQSASVLLDRIVRQGRAFGIHVILGSQTLGGAYSLARTTLGQMVIRIALQCNEADAYLIMDDNNPAPRLLSRPGEGIYNDSAGAIEGNSPFQVCWLSDDERDARLDEVRAMAEQDPALDATPIVFEGNAPADIGANEVLSRTLAITPELRPSTPRAWIGAPNSIKGPTEIALPRQSGANLLIAGQRDEASLAMLGNCALALDAQYPAESARFLFLHQNAADTAEFAFLEALRGSMRHEPSFGGAPESTEMLAELHAELQRRLDGDTSGPDIFLFVHGLQRFRKLRAEDDFDFSSDAASKPSAQFSDLVTEGPAVGIHVLTSIDTLGSVNRFMNRKVLAEFGLRVLFQMSANDSASLIDSPKAGDLGLHRALLYSEHAGTLETFRPYATPSKAWLASAGKPASQGSRKVPVS